MSNTPPFLTPTFSSSRSSQSFGYKTPTSGTSTESLLPSHEDPDEIEAYRQRGLNSPPKGPTSIPCSMAEEKMQEDGLFQEYGEDPAYSPMVFFLYGRGFMANSKGERRVGVIRSMIKEKKPQERFRRLLYAAGDLDLSRDGTAMKICNKSKEALEFYFLQPNTIGFLPDMTAAQYFFRFQKSGNCFLQAPCIMMSYLSQKYGFEATDPVDLSKFIRHTFTDSELVEYVIKDSGGDAKYMLDKLLRIYGEKDVVVEEHTFGLFMKTAILPDLFNKRGPFLVRNFHVHKNFTRKPFPDVRDDAIGYIQYSGANQCVGRFVCTNESDSEEVEAFPLTAHEEVEVSLEEHRNTLDSAKTPSTTGTHAMIMIGIRIDEKKRFWCLLQNWWRSMQLVEVSLDYLQNCKASICYYEPSTGFNTDGGSTIEQCHAPVAECCNLDRSEEVQVIYDRAGISMTF